MVPTHAAAFRVLGEMDRTFVGLRSRESGIKAPPFVRHYSVRVAQSNKPFSEC
jgi:hypothetical protein